MDTKYSPCVGSGLCCQKAPCDFGEWDVAKKSCKFLEEGFSYDNLTIFRCGRYEYIKQQPGNEIMPAFGAGCCMSLFNTGRQKIIKEINSGNEAVINFIFR